MKKRISILTLAVLVCIGTAFSAGERPAEKDRLVFLLPSNQTALFKQIDALWNTVGEKIGTPIDVITASDIPVEDPTTEQIAEWAKKLLLGGTVDITVLPPTSLFIANEQGAGFVPVITYQVDGNKYDRACLYVKRGSGYAGLEGDDAKIAAMKGKKIGIGHGIKANPVGEMLLFDHGVKTRSDAYFRYQGEFGGLEDKIEQTLDGTLDGFITLNMDMKFTVNRDKKYAEGIEPLVCGGEYANLPIVVRNGLDPEIVSRLRKVFLRIHKDRDFSQLHFLFYVLNGHFVPVGDEDYGRWEEICRKGRKEGWIDGIGEVMYEMEGGGGE